MINRIIRDGFRDALVSESGKMMAIFIFILGLGQVGTWDRYVMAVLVIAVYLDVILCIGSKMIKKLVKENTELKKRIQELEGNYKKKNALEERIRELDEKESDLEKRIQELKRVEKDQYNKITKEYLKKML